MTHIRRRKRDEPIDRPNVLLHAIYGFIEVVAVVMRNINNNQDERIITGECCELKLNTKPFWRQGANINDTSSIDWCDKVNEI